jgi:pyrimidine operon attenuation protein / uracil phosphoribosyltransferase
MAGGALTEKRTLADAERVSSMLAAMAGELAPSLLDGGPVALIGIQTGGVHVAQRLRTRLEALGVRDLRYGTLDITLYRDDIGLTRHQPEVRHTDIPFELWGVNLILVDDVLYTGRTVRAALDALVDFGRPRCIRLAVLVDRGLREYPIQADCAGMKVDTSPVELVQVELVEMGAPADRVVVYQRGA